MTRPDPDRGHPVAQQVVLGTMTVLSTWLLVASSLPPRWFSPPGWVWPAWGAVVAGLFAVYVGYWLWPVDRSRSVRDSNP